mmetsp:Transcript_65698/g.186471  ORF Transcript_65698/g.186471 Transcript_65698/m.186471 type:complete len:363 (-) Transcript_65698:1296-2384(-)
MELGGRQPQEFQPGGVVKLRVDYLLEVPRQHGVLRRLLVLHELVMLEDLELGGDGAELGLLEPLHRVHHRLAVLLLAAGHRERGRQRAYARLPLADLHQHAVVPAAGDAQHNHGHHAPDLPVLVQHYGGPPVLHLRHQRVQPLRRPRPRRAAQRRLLQGVVADDLLRLLRHGDDDLAPAGTWNREVGGPVGRGRPRRLQPPVEIVAVVPGELHCWALGLLPGDLQHQAHVHLHHPRVGGRQGGAHVLPLGPQRWLRQPRALGHLLGGRVQDGREVRLLDVLHFAADEQVHALRADSRLEEVVLGACVLEFQAPLLVLVAPLAFPAQHVRERWVHGHPHAEEGVAADVELEHAVADLALQALG